MSTPGPSRDRRDLIVVVAVLALAVAAIVLALTRSGGMG